MTEVHPSHHEELLSSPLVTFVSTKIAEKSSSNRISDKSLNLILHQPLQMTHKF